MDEALIRPHLDICLVTNEELATQKWKEDYEDNWPVENAYAL